MKVFVPTPLGENIITFPDLPIVFDEHYMPYIFVYRISKCWGPMKTQLLGILFIPFDLLNVDASFFFMWDPNISGIENFEQWYGQHPNVG